VIDDLGSGVLAPDESIAAFGDEPDLKRSLAAGAALVCCSSDKLLGGPQAGLLLGTRAAVAAARSHPLARALRIDKLSLAALQATLLLYRDPERARAEIPVLAMLGQTEEVLGARAQRLCDGIGERAEVTRGVSRVGGGALPLTELEGPVVVLTAVDDPTVVSAHLRGHDPPVITRIHDGRVLLDPRTLTDEEVEVVARAVRDALGVQ
jgi:L-seryl-tRNA(Ser) seleniumtransferase